MKPLRHEGYNLASTGLSPENVDNFGFSYEGFADRLGLNRIEHTSGMKVLRIEVCRFKG